MTDTSPRGPRTLLAEVTAVDEIRAIMAVRWLYRHKRPLWESWPPHGRLGYVVGVLLQLSPFDPTSRARLHAEMARPAMAWRCAEIITSVAIVDDWPAPARPVPVTLLHGMS